MPVSDDFLNYVLDQLSDWGPVSVRRMFGGAGLYREGRMFGLIADDVVYLKVDDASRDDFVQARSSPFNPYPELNKATAFSYYEVPPEVLENREAFRRWAQRSLAIQQKKQAGLAAGAAKIAKFSRQAARTGAAGKERRGP
jgi:DNA transformation protein and related proteins